MQPLNPTLLFVFPTPAVCGVFTLEPGFTVTAFINVGGIDMDRIDAPLERRDGDAEYYVAIARGFKNVAEFRAFRAARETRGDVSDYERRLALSVLTMEVR